jgi:hypothetical protein
LLTADEVVDAFALLALELPDPKQELSPQNLGRKLETFTCFPKLPPELRWMIWRLTFPGRRMIDFALSVPRTAKLVGRRATDPKLPIALYVNQESRSISLKTYYIIFQSQPIFALKKETKPGIRPFCFDPKVDLVYVDFLDILLLWPRWDDEEPSGTDLKALDLIKSIEVRGFEWFGPGDETWLDKSTAEIIEEQEGGILRYLTGLEEIHLVFEWCEIGEELFEDPNADSHHCFLTLKAYFDREKMRDPNRRPFPRIYLHNYRRRTTRSDVDYMSDAMIEWPFLVKENNYFEWNDDNEWILHHLYGITVYKL